MVRTIVLSMLILCAILPAYAGTGSSNVVLQDIHSAQAFYGTTEIGWPYSLINYIDLTVSVPGFRIGDNLAIHVSVNPDTTQTSILSSIPDTYATVGPGISSTTLTIRVYTPSSPDARIRVRRGLNLITVSMTYNYVGSAGSDNCGQDDTCGTMTTAMTVN